MDFSDILLLLIFVALPLLQQLFGKRPPPSDLEAGAEEEAAEEAATAARRAPHRLPGDVPAAEPEQRRSAQRRMEAAEELAGREVVDEEEAAELVVLQSRLPAESVPEAVRVSSPVVSLETVRREAPARPSKRAPRAASPPRRLAPVHPGALPLHRGQLRHAVLLSEILGPPKSLQ